MITFVPFLHKTIMFFRKKYRVLFFDLDHTLWDFDANARDCIYELFKLYKLDKYADFECFFETYEKHNKRLWAEYEGGNLKKEALRALRFHLTLKDFGLDDYAFAEQFGLAYIQGCPLKTKLFPHTVELLEYLQPRYRMAIISNGFPEVQDVKLRSCGIDGYFEKVFTSELVGYQKPRPEIFHAATTAFNAKKKHCLMIGDSWANDITGARNYGMDHVFFNPSGTPSAGPAPTFEIRSLKELFSIL